MPKIVDNYVFQRKIGSGQYGNVFMGYNKTNNQDIAIKAIKRQNIKGKFLELLENEIKVLKTCDNRNIIKLYDIKKTANNFYLILEFCNEGDLSQYLKKKKIVSENQAIEFLVQILNAFKTLVKHKIMHRDFKLANILMHDGEIKIADFGFSKLLTTEEFTETMLGSPLNMAPQVLGGTQYNNKADIWSIGVVFYEILFGTPPYKASNMVDLVNNIKNKPLTFPKHLNQISDLTEDVLRKMLVVDPKRRIEWQDLFNHPIMNYLEDKIKKEMESTMKEGDDLELNASKFYMKNNMVVDHPKEIEKKEELNNYTYNVLNKKVRPNDFQGEMIKRESHRSGSVEKGFKDQDKTADTGYKGSEKELMTEQETQREKQIKAFKRNAKHLLHYRNIYVFLASVAEESIAMGSELDYADVVGYLLIRKLLQLLQWLKKEMDNDNEFKGMKYWQQFRKTKDYKDIRVYVEKEHNVFRVFYESVHKRIKVKVAYLDEDTKETILNHHSKNNEKIFQKTLKEYANNLYHLVDSRKFKVESEERKYFIHLNRILDCLKLDQVFVFEKNGVIFNFHTLYEEPQRIQIEVLKDNVRTKMNKI